MVHARAARSTRSASAQAETADETRNAAAPNLAPPRVRHSFGAVAILSRQALVEPPLVTQFRQVGQLVPAESYRLPDAPSATRRAAENAPAPAREETREQPPGAPVGPSPQAIYFLMRREGFYAHPDDVSDPNNCTVGYGLKLHAGPCDGRAIEQRFARGITEEDALRRLVSRLVRVANHIRAHLTVTLAQHQFDALATFGYSSGEGSDLLAALINTANSGALDRVPQLIRRFTGARSPTGRLVHPPGLIDRRDAEAAMWERGDYGSGRPRTHYGCRRLLEDCTDREHPRPLRRPE